MCMDIHGRAQKAILMVLLGCFVCLFVLLCFGVEGRKHIKIAFNFSVRSSTAMVFPVPDEKENAVLAFASKFAGSLVLCPPTLSLYIT